MMQMIVRLFFFFISFLSSFFGGSQLCKEVTFTSYQGFISWLWKPDHIKQWRKQKIPPERCPSESCNQKPSEHNQTLEAVTRVPLLHTIQKHSYQPLSKINCNHYFFLKIDLFKIVSVFQSNFNSSCTSSIFCTEVFSQLHFFSSPFLFFPHLWSCL